MSDFKLAYVPIGVPTFELVSAGEQFEKSKKMLRSLCADAVMFLTSAAAVRVLMG